MKMDRSQAFACIEKHGIKYILLLFFIVCSIGILANRGSWVHEYTLGEWLINYGGGFVRRGLAGFIILEISESLSVSPTLIINSLLSFVFLLNLIIISLLARRLTVPQTFWLLFGPTLFIMIPVDTINRKENLFFLLIGMHSLLFQTKSIFLNPFEKYLLPLFGLLATLTHELYIFFLPFHFVLIFSKKEKIPPSLIALNLIPLIGFIMAITHPGTSGQRDLICQQIQSFGIPCSGGATAIGMKAADSINSSIQVIGKSYSLQSYWLVYSISIIATLLLFKKDIHASLLNNSGKFLILANLGFPLVFISGWDIGRWTSLYVIHNFLILSAFRVSHQHQVLTNRTFNEYVLAAFSVITISLFMDNRGCCGYDLKNENAQLSASKVPYFFSSGLNFLINENKINLQKFGFSPPVIQETSLETTSDIFDNLSGWSHKEPMGRWTIGSEVTLPIMKSSSHEKLCFKGHGFLPGPSSGILAEVYSEGSLLGRFEYSRLKPDGERCISVPSSRASDTRGPSITLKLAGYSSPASHGLSTDDRLLGIFLEKIYFK